MKKLITICAVVVLVGGIANANITIDADGFADGTILNNAFPGVTLTALGDGLANSNVLAESSLYSSTGSKVFSHTGTIAPGWGDGIFEYLRVDFAAGATSVTLDFIADDSLDNNPILNAYNSSGTLVDTATVAGNYNTGDIVTLTVSASYIAYITAEGDPVNRIHDWNLDNLQANIIPAPGAILLGSIGVTFVGWLRRKRTL